MHTFDRRDFVLGSLAFGVTATFSRRATAHTPSCPVPSPGEFGIDSHCHIFNGHDIPIAGFVSKWLKGYTDGVAWGIGDIAVDLIFPVLVGIEKAIRFGVATADQELQALLSSAMTMPAVPSVDEFLDVAARSVLAKRPNLKGIEKGIIGLAARTPEDNAKIVGAYLNTQTSDPGIETWILKDLGDVALPKTKNRKAFLPPVEVPSLVPRTVSLYTKVRSLVDGIFKFFQSLRSNRAANLARLARLSPHISLFTPAIVDFDLYAEKKTASQGSDVALQVLLMTKLSRDAAAGRIGPRPFFMHGFVAFNPRKKEALDVIKDAVINGGFIGVKLYLNCGFTPDRNSDASVNDRLQELYRFCRENGVPILAHTGTFNAFGKKAREVSHPRNWKRVLEARPNEKPLTLCLGHAALGEEDETWRDSALELCDQRRFNANIFFDISNNDYLDETKPGERARLERLRALKTKLPDLYSRLVYGTDWFMNELNEEPSEGYWCRVRAQLAVEFGEGKMPAIFSQNAQRYLGLDGGANHDRLKKFYGGEIPWLRSAGP